MDELSKEEQQKKDKQHNKKSTQKQVEEKVIHEEEILSKDTQAQQIAEDNLLACLLILAKFHHHPVSADVLTSGLPLVNNRLTPELFTRAAIRANLDAKVNKVVLSELKNGLLPAVVLLKNNHCCILTKISDDGKTCQVIQPDGDNQSVEMNIDVLQKDYAEHIIFVRAKYKFHERMGAEFKEKQKHWFWGVVLSAWPIYSEVLMASFFVNIFALAIPLFVMNVYDRVIPNQAIETLWVLALGVLLAFGFDFLLRTIRGYFIDNTAKNVDAKLSAAIFEKIMAIQMAARPTSTGAFANNLQSFEAFREFITSASITTLVDVPFIILFILIVGFIGGWLFLVPLIIAPIVIIVSFFIQIPLNSLVRKSFKFSAEKQATLYETISGAEAIKVMSAQTPMQRKWEQIICQSDSLGVKIRSLSNLAINFSLFAQQLASVLVVIFGVYLISNGDLTMGGLIACTILTGRAVAPMGQIAGLLIRYYQSKTSLDSLNQVMALPIERPADKQTVSRENLQGNIQFKKVSFKYPNQPIHALDEVSLRINSGERIGILGRIGSGKTTLGRLIVKLYQPESGSILMDKVDIQQLDPVDIRRHIGYVSQDIMLFYGSVKENITFHAPFVDDAAIIRAAQLSGVDRFISRHPEGFDMQIGERGENLSGGQRQAICIARALLLDPSIIILDEPTNAMDEFSERIFKTQLLESIGNKTLILMTHKGSMLDLVNRLIIMDGGKVVADGPKDQIIQALKDRKIKSPT